MAALSRLHRLFNSNAPTASIEIAADRVTGITLRRGPGRQITAVVTEHLPDGALTPSANATNMTDRSVVGAAVGRVMKQLPGPPRRVALVVPDNAAKVSLMTFEELPARPSDLDQLVRWQARKTAPFRIEDAQVTYSPGLKTESGGRELIVSLMRRDIVEEYEAVCTNAGGQVGVVDLASISLVNAVLSDATADADWLMVHVAHGYSTIVIVRHGHVILFRNRPSESDANLSDLVHQTTMYYEDRLQGNGFGRVFLVMSASDTEAEYAALVRGSLETRLETVVEAIDVGLSGPTGGETAGAPRDLMAAPLGILLRERQAAETGA
jgi:Tfp pilus assembly PilM family ATPase